MNHENEYSEESLERFHKIFAHISEFPHLDPSVGDVDDTDYSEEYTSETLESLTV
jgi:hypothetical protein